jgi:hypothetical protein
VKSLQGVADVWNFMVLFVYAPMIFLVSSQQSSVSFCL